MKKFATLTLFTLAIGFAPLQQADAQSAFCRMCVKHFKTCEANCPDQDIPYETCLKGCENKLHDCVQHRCKDAETPAEKPAEKPAETPAETPTTSQ